MLTIILGTLVGLSLGLTGGGGSLFAVPLLIYVSGIQPQLATTVSLAAVASMSAFGAIEAGINKMVEWRASLIFVIGGIIFAPVGVHIATHLGDTVIVTSFAVLMLIIAVSMWYRASKQPGQASIVRVNYNQDVEMNGAICKFDDNQAIRLSAPCSVALVVCGGVTGILSGVFGVGGGFLIVPALTFITQLNIHRAVASSLFVISLIGISGVSAAVYQGRPIAVDVTVLFILGGLAGMLLGRLIVKRISSSLLQKVFAMFIFVIALGMLIFKL